MIMSVGFDPSSCVLEVEFKNGAVWQYYDFSESQWYEFQGSESKGKYFNKHIRDKFQGNQI